MTANPLLVAADRLDPKPNPYRYDPVAWVHDCIDWRPGEGPTGYQEQILDALVEHHRVAVRGPHGLGKTATDAWVVLWFADTRDQAGDDWKLPTTASAWRQLTHYLWPEVRKWARRLRWDKVGRSPFNERTELLHLNLKLRTGEAFSVASNDASSIEGAHGDSILYLFDEAKTIPADTFDAAEGAFSGAGPDTAAEAYALANSTPGEPHGRFYEIHTRKPGLEDWHPIHVTLDDAVDAGRVSREWAEQRAKQWGARSAAYLNRVEGEFAASDEDGVIPLAWIEAANQRWLTWRDSLTPLDFTCVGVDVARSGSDRTVLAMRHGKVLAELRRFQIADTMGVTGQVVGALTPHLPVGGYAVVDIIGIGSGVFDRLREQDIPAVPFNASESTPMLDRSGELGFVNKRSAAWWNLRELLDPANGEDVALPDDDLLIGDLTAPRWRVSSGGKIRVEEKAEIRKRLGRSTDDGDAVIQAYWIEGPPSFDLASHTERKTITGDLLKMDF